MLLAHGATITDTYKLGEFVQFAASAGQTEAVKYLIGHGASPNAALFAAGNAGRLETLQWLIDSGIEFNTPIPTDNIAALKLLLKHKDIFGGWFYHNVRDGLNNASAQGQIEALELLWEHIDPNSEDKRENQNLKIAVKAGKKNAVAFWLDKKADPIEANAIATAIENHSFEILKYLVEDRGVDLRKERVIGLVAMQWNLTVEKKIKLIEYLLSKKADPNAHGGEALIYARSNKDREVEKYLREHGAIETPEYKLFFAVSNRDATEVKKLLDEGVSPDLFAEGMLNDSGYADQPDIAALLLEKMKKRVLPSIVRDKLKKDPKWAKVAGSLDREDTETMSEEGVPTWVLPLSDEQLIVELGIEKQKRKHFDGFGTKVFLWAAKKGNTDLI